MPDDESVSRRAKIDAPIDVARYRPRFTVGIVALGVVAAVLEGTVVGSGTSTQTSGIRTRPGRQRAVSVGSLVVG